MSRINWSRVILAGLVAGIVVNVSEYVLNIVVMKPQWQAAMHTLARPYPESAAALAGWALWGLLIGFALAWLYAAVRPRFGAGLRSAAAAAMAGWCLDCLVPAIAFSILGLLPLSMVVILSAWAVPEHLLAATAAGWIYRESS